ncbi:hypothetical protein [Krasilnikovia sp. M28-CT-15]|uniref:hypothetical protein n=1 Tax=Krasilnikovia sp. M28-CT-15 TaxID=3373540 RepID=UPI00399D3A77
MVVVGIILRRASEVLIVGRTTVSDILDCELAERMVTKPRIKLGRLPSKAMRSAFAQISVNREWLLGDYDSTQSVFAAYQQSRESESGTTSDTNDEGSKSDSRAEIAARLNLICEFVRAEICRAEYNRLSRFVAGGGGIVFSVAVIAFAVTLGWPTSKPPSIAAPLPVAVHLIGNQTKLSRAKIPASCLPGTQLSGIAIDGTLSEPVVVTEATDSIVDGRESSCPVQRFVASKELAIVIPKPGKIN